MIKNEDYDLKITLLQYRSLAR